MDRGIQYLRQLTMLEEIYGHVDNKQLSKDPGEVKCTQPVRWKFVWDAPLSYINSLAVMAWKDDKGQMVDKLASSNNTNKMPLPRYRPVSWLWTRKADGSYFLPVWTSVPAITSKCTQHKSPCVMTERT